MMLNGKVAVIYGAGGWIGSAVARAFASEGAELFLTGHRLGPVEALAKGASNPPRLPRWTLSTSRPWTGICSP